MRLLIGLACSIIGGAIGAGIWALIAYYANIEIAWIAVIVGGLAGAGMAIGVKQEGTIISGGLAAIVALLAMSAGKYVTVELVLTNIAAKHNIKAIATVDESKAQLYMARQLAEEAQAAGKTLKWPGGKEPEDGIGEQKDVPADIWKDVQTRWNAMDSAQQTTYIASVQTQYDQVLAEGMNEARQKGFIASFDAMDIMFFVIAIGVAYKCGEGLLKPE